MEPNRGILEDNIAFKGTRCRVPCQLVEGQVYTQEHSGCAKSDPCSRAVRGSRTPASSPWSKFRGWPNPNARSLNETHVCVCACVWMEDRQRGTRRKTNIPILTNTKDFYAFPFWGHLTLKDSTNGTRVSTFLTTG